MQSRYHFYIPLILIMFALPLFSQQRMPQERRQLMEMERDALPHIHGDIEMRERLDLRRPEEVGNVLPEKDSFRLGAQWPEPNRSLMNPNGRRNSTGTYETNDQIRTVLWTYEYWDGTQWGNGWRMAFNYDVDGNETVRLVDVWDGTQWGKNARDTYTYGVNGNLAELLWEYWESTQWVYSSKFTYTYEENGILIETLIKYWDDTQWVNSNNLTCTYDVDGDLTEELTKRWDSTHWVNKTKITYTYDVNGDKTEELHENWNVTEWVNDWRYNYTYDAVANEILWQRDTWDGAQWVNLWKYTSNYDASGKRTQDISENFDGSQWAYGNKRTYTYDDNGYELGYLRYTWDGTSWVISSRRTITYTWYELAITDLNNRPTPESYALHPAYPNPFNPVTTIEIDLPAAGYVSMVIYDMMGREVTRLVDGSIQAGYHTLRWNGRGANGSAVATGLYIVRLVTAEYTKSIKLLFMK